LLHSDHELEVVVVGILGRKRAGGVPDDPLTLLQDGLRLTVVGKFNSCLQQCHPVLV